MVPALKLPYGPACPTETDFAPTQPDCGSNRYRLGTSDYKTVDAILAHLIEVGTLRAKALEQVKADVIAGLDDGETRWPDLQHCDILRTLNSVATIPADTAAKIIASAPPPLPALLPAAATVGVNVEALNDSIRKLGVEPPSAEEALFWLVVHCAVADHSLFVGADALPYTTPNSYNASKVGIALLDYKHVIHGKIAGTGWDRLRSFISRNHYAYAREPELLGPAIKTHRDWFADLPLDMEAICAAVLPKEPHVPMEPAMIDPMGIFSLAFLRLLMGMQARKTDMKCTVASIYGEDVVKHADECMCGDNGVPRFLEMTARWVDRRNKIATLLKKLGVNSITTLAPPSIVAMQRYLATPFKALDQIYEGYVPPAAVPYGHPDYGNIVPKVSKNSPFGCILRSEGLASTVPEAAALDIDRLTSCVATFEEHTKSSIAAVKSVLQEYGITEQFVFDVYRHKADSIQETLQSASTDLRTLSAASSFLNGSFFETPRFTANADRRADTRMALKKTIIELALGANGTTAGDVERSAKEHVATAAARSARLMEGLEHIKRNCGLNAVTNAAKPDEEPTIALWGTRYSGLKAQLNKNLPAAATDIIDAYIYNPKVKLADLDTILKLLAQAKAREPGIVSLIETVKKTTDSHVEIVPTFSYHNFTGACFEGKCACVAPTLKGAQNLWYYGGNKVYATKLQAYLQHFVAHGETKGVTEAKMRKIVTFVLMIGTSADWLACIPEVQRDFESSCPELKAFLDDPLGSDPAEVMDAVDEMAAQRRHMTTATMRAVKALDPTKKRRKRGWGRYY